MALRPSGCLARGRRGSVLPVRSRGLLRGPCDGLAVVLGLRSSREDVNLGF